MSQSKLFLLFTLLAGIGIGAWARDAIQSDPVDLQTNTSFGTDTYTSNTVNPTTDAATQQVIDDLRAELERAELERGDLREQLETLSVRLSALDKKPVANVAPRNDVLAAREMAQKRRGAGGLTLAALTDAGITERDATAIKSRLDELSMQRLYLRDQAQREGWLGKEEYRNEIRRLNTAQNNLAEEFGSDNYSRYLYATGRPNQVNVQSVIENSPAYTAGMQNGDRLISYDNQPIYDTRAIRQGTQRGTAGEMVPVVVLRNGQQMEIYVPRGPLGITMDSQSVRPPDRP